MRILLYSLREFGLDPIKFLRAIKFFPRYIRDILVYVARGRSLNFLLSPVLNDFSDNSGSATGHYFWQDLLCAQWIRKENPRKHLDVGSRLDGFISHLLTFRDVQILDVRDLGYEVPGLSTIVYDIQQPIDLKSDSVSSLHSIEHFGLGRYSDRIDPSGHINGLINISKFVEHDGYLYVSFPIGKPRVQFNAQRILDPSFPIHVLENFQLEEFVIIPWKGAPIFGVHPSDVNIEIANQAGLYKFRRINN
jgi:hypothetical protein